MSNGARGLFYGCLISLILWAIIIFFAVKAFGVEPDGCRFQYLQHGVWTPHEEERTSRCALKRFGPIPGGYPKLKEVGMCESGWNRLAKSSSSSYLGLFQHSRNYWPGRVRQYEPAHWTLNTRWQNSRTAIVVTVRMVRAQGWTAWTCA